MTMVPGLMSMLRSAQIGIADSHARAASAADEVVRAGMPQDTVSISAEARAAAADGPAPDMVRGMVDLRLARYQQTANLAVARTADEMLEELTSL